MEIYRNKKPHKVREAYRLSYKMVHQHLNSNVLQKYTDTFLLFPFLFFDGKSTVIIIEGKPSLETSASKFN